MWTRLLDWLRKLPTAALPAGPPTITSGRKLRAIKRRRDKDGHVKEPTEVVIHESCTRDRDKCWRWLKSAKYGVHFMVDRDGGITRHVDPRKYCTVHAGGQHNRPSVAVEVLNTYYGADAIKDEVVIKAIWAHRRRYILPTEIQVEAVWRLIAWLDVEFDALPLQFPCVDGANFLWGRHHAHGAPGITAHHRHKHADALFVEHYCAVRARGYDAAQAWCHTIEAARSGKRRTAMPEQLEV